MWFLHILPPKAFLFVSLGVMLLVPSLVGKQIHEVYGIWFGIALGFVLVRYTIRYFLDFTPKKQARLIMNPLNSDGNGEAQIRTVLSGFNAQFPWEQAEDDGLFSLEDVRV